jgi:hypothetical protein
MKPEIQLLPFTISREIAGTMAVDNSKRTGFRIDNGPVGDLNDAVSSDANGPVATMPHLLFAVARDPRTIFTYWNVDWPAAFAGTPPPDRRIYVRALRDNGTEESESVVEPLLGSFYIPVAHPGATYRVELGYYSADGRWQSVVLSDIVAVPPDEPSENTAVDVATVPFHLTFQRIIDLFSLSKTDPLTVALSQLQQRAIETTNGEAASESSPEGEVLRALEMSVEDLRTTREPFQSRPNDKALRKRIEAILGVGATSPGQAFSSSDWTGS